jgi:glutamate-ammonia-ligase adenylyltransferase
MIDVEFIVQFLVLSACAEHPELRGNVGNIALLQRGEAAGMLPSGMGEAAAAAYRELRHLQHRARLDESSTQFDPAPLQVHIDAVLALWAHVLGD